MEAESPGRLKGARGFVKWCHKNSVALLALLTALVKLITDILDRLR